MKSKHHHLVHAAALMLVPVAVLYAGGFWLELGTPSASAEAQAAKAFLTVKAVGCHQPERAEVTGEAIGVRNGKRETIPLKISRMSTPGMFAVTRQWPEQGNWTLRFVARQLEVGAVTGMLVKAGPDGVDRASAKFMPREPNAADLDELIAKR